MHMDFQDMRINDYYQLYLIDFQKHSNLNTYVCIFVQQYNVGA